MKIKWLLLGLLLFWAVRNVAATTLVVQKEIALSRALAGRADIRGTGAPASGVKVELCSPGWKTVLASTNTDEKGYFSLRKPATGKLFYLRLSAKGLDTYEIRVRIKKEAQELTIHLSVAT